MPDDEIHVCKTDLHQPVVGVSSCLLGERVRYDGDHQLQPVLNQVLARHIDFRPFCPEMAIGLGVPRLPIHLEAGPHGTLCRGAAGEDHTPALRGCAQSLELADLCGYIFKQSSPSCGLSEVKVYRGRHFRREGRGIFADTIVAACPALPVAEETVFQDAETAANFLQRVFVMDRWHQMLKDGLTVAQLTRFHARHKLMLLAHCQKTYRSLSADLGTLNEKTVNDIAVRYLGSLMQALQKPASRGDHLNVLHHLQGYLRRLEGHEKEELKALLVDYGAGRVPRAAPLQLLRTHFQRSPHPWVTESWYVFPDAREQALQEGL